MKRNKIIGVKEIKSIEITSFSLMASSIEAIIAFLTAVFTLIIFEASTVISHFNIYSNVITSFDVAFIIISPISGFFIILAVSYFSILLYNTLTPRIGGVKLGLDGNEITQIPLLSFALILAIIEAIWAFIIGLLILSALPALNTLLHTSTPIISTIININTLGLNPIRETGVMSPLLIIGLPIAVFIMGFTYNILIALLYNYLGPKMGKFKLEFVNVDASLYELKSIPVKLVPIAVASGIVLAALGFLVELMSLIGLIDLVTLSTVGNLLGLFAFRGDVIIYFIPTFIIVTLVAVFYNYLVPIIGGIKAEME
jgi:hypothetical protein